MGHCVLPPASLPLGNRGPGGGPSPYPPLVGPRRSRGQRPLVPAAGSSPSAAFVGSARRPSSQLRPQAGCAAPSPDPFPDGWEEVRGGHAALWRFVFSWGRGPRTGGGGPRWVGAAGPSSAPVPVTPAVSTALGNSLSPSSPSPTGGGVGEGGEQATRGLRPPTKLEDGMRGPTKRCLIRLMAVQFLQT